MSWAATPKKADLWWSNPKEAEITKDQLYVRQSKPTGNAVAFEVAGGRQQVVALWICAGFLQEKFGERKISTTTWNHNDNGYSFSTQHITGLFNVPKNGLDFLLCT